MTYATLFDLKSDFLLMILLFMFFGDDPIEFASILNTDLETTNKWVTKWFVKFSPEKNQDHDNYKKLKSMLFNTRNNDQLLLQHPPVGTNSYGRHGYDAFSYTAPIVAEWLACRAFC